jgi:hypothetical protein
MKNFVWGLLLISLITGCKMKQNTDLIIVNSKAYTVDSLFSIQTALAVRDGKILETGSDVEILGKYKSNNVIDLDGAPLYPGFNDAHCHITGLGKGLGRVDLRGATSYKEVLERLVKRYKESSPSYLEGDGWNQTLWEEGDDFPDNRELSRLFPDIPVILYRIDYHAVIVNDAAIRALGIYPGDKSIPDGEAIMQNGTFKGVFLENTAERFRQVLPVPDKNEYSRLLLAAQQECFRNGLTSISHAGEVAEVIEVMEELNASGELKLRTDIWLTPDQATLSKYSEPFSRGRIRIGTIKLFADGALGSRGALMIEPYSDMPQTKGIPVIGANEFDSLCRWAAEREFQVAIHCIGDAANRFALDTYAKYLEEGNDLRWRIEHAQIIAPGDLDKFGKYRIVPSIQPTHATSDMLWADERIGDRLRNAYMYKELLDQLGWIPSGTDFPVEQVNPLYTFFAAVSRRNLDMVPQGGFQMENALSREEALRSMTIWAAKASFEEALKGSLEPGKYADFVVLDKDIMTLDEDSIPAVKVLKTFVNGELVYSN